MALEDLSYVIKAGSIILVDKYYFSKHFVAKLKAQGLLLLALNKSIIRNEYETALTDEQ